MPLLLQYYHDDDIDEMHVLMLLVLHTVDDATIASRTCFVLAHENENVRNTVA
jgi:hypothetical protein